MSFVAVPVLIVAALFVMPVVIGVKTRSTRVVLPVALLLTGGALFWAWTGVGVEQEVLDSIVSVEGNELTVMYIGGECEDQRSVTVDEDDDQVRISVATRSFASGCSDIGMLHTFAVTLDGPLSSREVVNVGCTRERRGCRRTLVPPASACVDAC
jgi:hypothetical protein